MAIDAEHQYDHGEVPRHLGLILDGNRRWAVEQGLPKFEGHKQGYQNLKTIGLAALERGVKFVTAYVFSTENWNRTQEEVKYLMNLLEWVLSKEVDELHSRNVRLRWLGTVERLSPSMLTAIRKAEVLTADNTGGTLGLCLNYGGQTEIVEAAAKVKGKITIESISDNLYAPEIPPIDLIIRTSGEQRLSNFMLWRAAYAEFYFASMHWPDFSVDDLDRALETYASRGRRFGT